VSASLPYVNVRMRQLVAHPPVTPALSSSLGIVCACFAPHFLPRCATRPEEYPSSLEGLYHSSPDEALPQFYCDPSAFASTHPSMRDLAVPDWAQDAADFVHVHR
jgi:hypothetical protein